MKVGTVVYLSENCLGHRECQGVVGPMDASVRITRAWEQPRWDNAIWVAGVMYACMVKNVASSGRVAFKSRYCSMYGYIMSICTNINNVWVGAYGKQVEPCVVLGQREEEAFG